MKYHGLLFFILWEEDVELIFFISSFFIPGNFTKILLI